MSRARLILQLLAFYVCCFAVPCFGQQYTTTFQNPVVDITSYATSGTNAWVEVVSGGQTCSPYTVTVGMKGFVLCVNNANKEQVMQWNGNSTGWQVNSSITGAVGTIMSLAAVNSSLIYSLQVTSHCSGIGNTYFGLFKSAGEAWSQVDPNGCFNVLSVAVQDGTIGATSGGVLFFSTDGGTAWTSTGTNNTFIYLVNDESGCTVNAGQVKIINPGALSGWVPYQPNFAVASCMKLADGTLLVTSASDASIAMMDQTTVGQWDTVTGIGVSQYLVGVHKSMILGEDTAGTVRHWNIAAVPELSGTSTGTFNKCPEQQCPPNAIHTGKIQVAYPHGISGTLASSAIPPTTNLNITSWDASPLCDFYFGDPTDPSCTPSVTADDICSVSEEDLEGPPDPPASDNMASFYYSFFDGNYNNISSKPCGKPGCTEWHTSLECEQLYNCRVGTSATCTYGYTVAFGLGPTQSTSIADAEAECGPKVTTVWQWYSTFTRGNPYSCHFRAVTPALPTDTNCHDITLQ